MSKPAWIFGLIVVAVLIAGLYRAKYGARDAAGDIAQIEAEIEAAQQRVLMLEAEVSHLSRREWIEEYARNELGMAPPRADQFIRPSDLDRRIGLPGAETRAETDLSAMTQDTPGTPPEARP
ncbi:MAG: cell division protein FtsL [Pseudomonadota bacterium]